MVLDDGATPAIGDRVRSRDFDLTSDNSAPRGIDIEDGFAYVVDLLDDKVYAYQLSDGAYTSSKDFNLTSDNSAPQGIDIEDGFAYVVDLFDDKVYAYQLSDGAYTSSKDFNLTSANSNPNGIDIEDGFAYVVDQGGGKVYAYQLSDGAYTSSKDFNLTSANSAPRGIDIEDGFAYVVDLLDDKVYAYQLSDGAYTSSKDFNLETVPDADGDADGEGITYDGGYLYVVDSDEDKVRVYVGPTPTTTVTANAGSNKTVASGGSTTIGGSDTVENGVGATSIVWSVVSGTTETIGNLLSSTTAESPTFTAPTIAPGGANLSIVLRKTVTNNGESDPDDVTITVTAPAQLPVAVAPSVTINAVAAGNEGTNVTLGAAIAGGTYDGSITYAWSVSGGTLNDATAAAPVWTRPSVTVDTDFTIDLTITVNGTGTNARNGTSDSRDATQISATVNNVVVLPQPEAGTVVITGATTATSGERVPLSSTLGGTRRGTITYAWTGDEIPPSSDKSSSSVDVQRSTPGNADVTLVTTATGDGTTVASGTDTATATHRVVYSAAPPSDTTPPTLVSSELNAAGNLLTMQFSESINNVPNQTAFDILDDGTRKSGTNHRINPDDDTQFLVDFTFAIASGSTVTLEYTKPNTNPLEDDAGNDVANFGPVNVTTNWPVPDAVPIVGKGTAALGASPATLTIEQPEGIHISGIGSANLGGSPATLTVTQPESIAIAGKGTASLGGSPATLTRTAPTPIAISGKGTAALGAESATLRVDRQDIEIAGIGNAEIGSGPESTVPAGLLPRTVQFTGAFSFFQGSVPDELHVAPSGGADFILLTTTLDIYWARRIKPTIISGAMMRVRYGNGDVVYDGPIADSSIQRISVNIPTASRQTRIDLEFYDPNVFETLLSVASPIQLPAGKGSAAIEGTADLSVTPPDDVEIAGTGNAMLGDLIPFGLVPATINYTYDTTSRNWFADDFPVNLRQNPDGTNREGAVIVRDVLILYWGNGLKQEVWFEAGIRVTLNDGTVIYDGAYLDGEGLINSGQFRVRFNSLLQGQQVTESPTITVEFYNPGVPLTIDTPNPVTLGGFGSAAFGGSAALTVQSSQAEPIAGKGTAAFGGSATLSRVQPEPVAISGSGTAALSAQPATLSRVEPEDIAIAGAGTATLGGSAALTRTQPAAIAISGKGSAAFAVRARSNRFRIVPPTPVTLGSTGTAAFGAETARLTVQSANRIRLSGKGNAAFGGTAALTRTQPAAIAIAGKGSAVFGSQPAVLTRTAPEAIAISGASNAAFGGQAALSRVQPEPIGIAGKGAVAFGTSPAALTRAPPPSIAVSGKGSASFGAPTAILTRTPPTTVTLGGFGSASFDGSATLTVEAPGAISIAGSGTALFDGSATLSAVAADATPIAGKGVAAFDGSATLSAVHPTGITFDGKGSAAFGAQPSTLSRTTPTPVAIVGGTGSAMVGGSATLTVTEPDVAAIVGSGSATFGSQPATLTIDESDDIFFSGKGSAAFGAAAATLTSIQPEPNAIAGIGSAAFGGSATLTAKRAFLISGKGSAPIKGNDTQETTTRVFSQVSTFFRTFQNSFPARFYSSQGLDDIIFADAGLRAFITYRPGARAVIKQIYREANWRITDQDGGLIFEGPLPDIDINGEYKLATLTSDEGVRGLAATSFTVSVTIGTFLDAMLTVAPGELLQNGKGSAAIGAQPATLTRRQPDAQPIAGIGTAQIGASPASLIVVTPQDVVIAGKGTAALGGSATLTVAASIPLSGKGSAVIGSQAAPLFRIEPIDISLGGSGSAMFGAAAATLSVVPPGDADIRGKGSTQISSPAATLTSVSPDPVVIAGKGSSAFDAQPATMIVLSASNVVIAGAGEAAFDGRATLTVARPTAANIVGKGSAVISSPAATLTSVSPDPVVIAGKGSSTFGAQPATMNRETARDIQIVGGIGSAPLGGSAALSRKIIGQLNRVRWRFLTPESQAEKFKTATFRPASWEFGPRRLAAFKSSDLSGFAFMEGIYATVSSGVQVTLFDSLSDVHYSFNLDSANANPVDIEFNPGGGYWVLNSNPGKVYVYNLAGELDDDASFDVDAAITAPTGITYVDGTLWIHSNRRLFGYDIDGTRENTSDFLADAIANNITTLGNDGTHILALDRNDQRVYAMTTTGARHQIRDIDYSGDDHGDIVGVAHAGNHYALLDQGRSRVSAYREGGFVPLSEADVNWDDVVRLTFSARDAEGVHRGRMFEAPDWDVGNLIIAIRRNNPDQEAEDDPEWDQVAFQQTGPIVRDLDDDTYTFPVTRVGLSRTFDSGSPGAIDPPLDSDYDLILLMPALPGLERFPSSRKSGWFWRYISAQLSAQMTVLQEAANSDRFQWPDAAIEQANIATPGDNRLGDVVTLYRGEFSSTRSWDGTSWIPVDQFVDGNLLVAGTVTAYAVAANAITTDKLVVGSVTGDKIANVTITGDKIALRAINGDLIAETVITAEHIATGAVIAAKIAAGAIVADKIAAGSVIAEKIAAGAIVAAKIASDAIEAKHIKASSVTGEKIAEATITGDKIVLAAITEALLGDGAVTGTKIASTTITAGNIVLATITGDQIASTTIGAGNIKTDAITAEKIAAGAIIAAKIAAGAIIAEKIAAGSILAEKIGANAVEAAKIKAGAIIAEKIAAGAVVAAKIAAGAVIAEKIGANAVEAEKIKAGAVVAAKIGAGAVIAEKIAANAVEAEKIKAGAVVAAKIGAGAVIAEKIAAGAIVAAKIAAGAVVADKIAAKAITTDHINLGHGVIASSGKAITIQTATNSGLVVASDGIGINVDGNTLTVGADGIKVDASNLPAAKITLTSGDGSLTISDSDIQLNVANTGGVIVTKNGVGIAAADKSITVGSSGIAFNIADSTQLEVTTTGVRIKELSVDRISEGTWTSLDESDNVLHRFALGKPGFLINGQSGTGYFQCDDSSCFAVGAISGADASGAIIGQNNNTGVAARFIQSYTADSNRSTIAFICGNGTPFRIRPLNNTASSGRLLDLDEDGDLTIKRHITARGTISGAEIAATSDIRLKENLVPITGALEKIVQLTGYTYNMLGAEHDSAGLVAQEVHNVLPQAVRENKDHLTLSPMGVIGLLVESIKEMKAEMDELRKEIDGLNAKR